MPRRFACPKLVVATHNHGKAGEIRTLLSPFGVEIVSAAELGLAAPEETGTTFEDNATLKALAATRASGLPALADDSGLSVQALDGLSLGVLPGTVIGIVGDVHQAGLDVPARAEMYLPYQQQDFGYQPEYLAVRTTGDPLALAEVVRQQIWAVDKEQPVAGVMPLEDLVDDNLASRKMQASLLSGFAALALLLVTLGIYAVLSFAVTQRTPEIGVRVALGAQPRDVLRMIFSLGFKLFLAGAAIGLAASLALSRALVHLLFGVSAYDPASFAGVTILLAAVALLACYLPARRAMRVDPLIALRYE